MNPEFPKRLYEAHKSIDDSTEKRGTQRTEEESAEKTADQILADGELENAEVRDDDLSQAA